MYLYILQYPVKSNLVYHRPIQCYLHNLDDFGDHSCFSLRCLGTLKTKMSHSGQACLSRLSGCFFLLPFPVVVLVDLAFGCPDLLSVELSLFLDIGLDGCSAAKEYMYRHVICANLQ